MATPAFHRWQHTNDEHREDNYAPMLPLFDRIFGTWHLPNGWPPCYGIDTYMSPSLVRQLLRPRTEPRRIQPMLSP